MALRAIDDVGSTGVTPKVGLHFAGPGDRRDEQ
jgi:hypothetical protein